MGKALYRKYRSKSLDEIVGQSHITDVLRRSIAQGRVAHAYLLTGPRGVGKTSIARILAHDINGLPYEDDHSHIDIIEIDAASNNGVEDIRDLRDKVQIAPVSAAKKIYIIDEVHMLSKAAFNALLKTLEEPPEHVVFILATTDAEKLPETIVSRTQRFGFRAISTAHLVEQLTKIAAAENIQITDEAIELIAEHGDGSFRDSISLLDQLSSLADTTTGITVELVEQSLGLAPRALVKQLIDAHQHAKLAEVVALLDQARTSGIQAKILARQLSSYLKTAIVTSPELLPLLDNLIGVENSPQPDIKLLTVLAPRSTPKTKPAPLLASVPEVILEAPIPALAKKATQKHPKDPEPTPAPKAETKKATPSTSLATFSWDALVEHVRAKHVALYSVLSKCSYDTADNTLIIYTNNKFYKKKLDDTKYRPLLSESLAVIGFSDVTIDTIPTASPLKDEQAAKVAAIMGGGEEVTINGE